MKKIGLFLLLCFAISIIANAKVIRVKHVSQPWIQSNSRDGSSWKLAYLDLQQAINDANPNDEIWVATGTYLPVRNAANYLQILVPDGQTIFVGGLQSAFVLKKDVKIYGGFSGNELALNQRNINNNPTILSAGLAMFPKRYSYHVVIAKGDMGTAYLDGFTINGGCADGVGSTIVDGINIPNDCGGGICVVNSNIIIQNATVSNNSGINGGGGIAVINSSPVLKNMIISENSTSGLGGGVYCQNQASKYDSITSMENVQVCRNEAVRDGGGIYCGNYTSPVLSNTLINDNYAGNDGGGIHIERLYQANLTNVTIAGNGCFRHGGGISGYFSLSFECTGEYAFYLKNTIIYGNYSVNNPANRSITHPALIDQSWNTLIQDKTVLGVNSNLSGTTDPLFVNASARNYQLSTNPVLSNCIGAGNNAFNTTSSDLNGNIRVRGYNIDLGAYESSNTTKSFFEEHETVFENEVNSEIKLNVFPNPVNNNQPINISLGKYDNSVGVRLYSLEGKLVHTKTCRGRDFELNIPDITSGIYIVNIQTQEGESFTKKIIVN